MSKTAINDYVVHGVKTAVNPNDYGTKAAAHYVSDRGIRRNHDRAAAALAHRAGERRDT